MRLRVFTCLQVIALAGLGFLLIYLSWVSTNTYSSDNEHNKHTKLNNIVNIPTIEPELFVQRQDKIADFCRDINTTNLKLPRTILYSKKLNTAYCPVTYVATTTMKYALLSTEGRAIRVHRLYQMSYVHGIQAEAQKLAIRRNLDKLSDKVSLVLIVRDPWQRLVTAYRRMTDVATPSYDMKWCSSALKLDEGSEISFDQFLDCVIKKREVQKLYLQPISEVCAVCKMGYNKIVRLENLMPELKTIYTRTDAKYQKETDLFLSAINSAPTSREDTYDITPYLQTVSVENQRQIEEVYGDDFKMFGYTHLNEFDPELSHKL